MKPFFNGVKRGFVAIALLIMYKSAVASVDLPFLDSFESGVNTTTVWTAASSCDAAATGMTFHGSQACRFTSGNMTLSVSAGNNSNVWVFFNARPDVYDDSSGTPSVDSADAGTFYINNSKVLKVYSRVSGEDTNAWTTLATSVSTNSWLSFSIHADFANSNWDIYASTDGAYGTVLTKLNSSALLFPTSCVSSQLAQFEVQNGATLDLVAASKYYSSIAGTPYSNLFVRVNTTGGMAVATIGSTYAADEDMLDAGKRLGMDLKTGLAVTDEILIMYTNGWSRYALNASTNWYKVSGSMALADAHIPPVRAFWLNRKAGSDAASFHPYNNTAIGAVTLAGTDDAAAGVDMLAWRFGASSASAAASDLGFGDAVLNDMIYIYINQSYVILRYKPLTDRWQWGNGSQTYTMTAGQTFWHINSQNKSADAEWTVP